MNHTFSYFKYLALLLIVISMSVSCQSKNSRLSASETALVKDSVTQLTSKITTDLFKNGPRAWLKYFEDAPGFFMANQGQIAFRDYHSAKVFILDTLIKNIPHIKLQWDRIRIDPLTLNFASIGAGFHEDLTDAGGKTFAFDGYFTGVAHFDGHSWKLRNLHWSIKAQDKAAD